MTKADHIARKIVENNIYLSLATSSDNTPWISPVFYAADDKFNFYFISDKNSLHARNIKLNPQVAVAIFNSTEPPEIVNGIQIEAEAKQIGLKELPHALRVIYAKQEARILTERFRDSTNPLSYLGKFPFRCYKITPKKAYILNPDISENDIRLEVKLK